MVGKGLHILLLSGLFYNVVIGLLLLVDVSNLHGQEKKEPPRRELSLPDDSTPQKGEAPLSKVDPQEFAITGNELIDLPEASKTSVEDKWVNHFPRTSWEGYTGIRCTVSFDTGFA